MYVVCCLLNSSKQQPQQQLSLPMIDMKMLKVYLKTMIEMLLGCVALCWRVEGSTSSWRLVKVKLSNTCRPLWRPFVVWLGSGWHCSLKTRLLCKTFFNKYYKMGAAQKPKSFTRKTIKPNRQQTNKYEKKKKPTEVRS